MANQRFGRSIQSSTAQVVPNPSTRKLHEQVTMEERISQTEKRVLAEAQKQFDLELAELRERIDAVHKVRRRRYFLAIQWTSWTKVGYIANRVHLARR